MKAKSQPRAVHKRNKFVRLCMRMGTRLQSAMQTRNTIFTMMMPFLIIPSRASESICRPCGVIIPTSRPAEEANQCRIACVLFGASSDA
jgi:hypothetical protein